MKLAKKAVLPFYAGFFFFMFGEAAGNKLATDAVKSEKFGKMQYGHCIV